MTASWKAVAWQRWGVALAASFVAVAVLANIAKLVVEGATDYSYTIHWYETVPLLVVGFAYLLQRRWRPATAPPAEA
ncbi:MAG: hypothetical protein ACPGQL_07480 [Thermoplasmatota archaeon]